jgi:hypothetical protein
LKLIESVSVVPVPGIFLIHFHHRLFEHLELQENDSCFQIDNHVEKVIDIMTQGTPSSIWHIVRIEHILGHWI